MRNRGKQQVSPLWEPALRTPSHQNAGFEIPAGW